MKLASLGAENKPLDRAFGKLDGIGGGGGVGGGAPIPITLPRVAILELFLTGICLLLAKWLMLRIRALGRREVIMRIQTMQSLTEGTSEQVLSPRSVDMNLARRFNAGKSWVKSDRVA